MKAGFCFFALCATLSAQWLNYPTPGMPRTADGKPNLLAPAPRTADGKPDLSGLWTKFSNYRDNITKDLNPADVQPWAKALVQQRVEDLSKDHMSARCLPLGPGYTTDADSKRRDDENRPNTIAHLDSQSGSYLSAGLHGRPRLGNQPHYSELDGILGGALGCRHTGGGKLGIQ